MAKNKLRLIRKILYFVLPVVLLYFIFSKTDLNRISSILLEANPLMIVLGIIIRPLQIVFGSIRWHLMNDHYSGSKVPLGYTMRHYWSGLVMGYFTPGNIGWDAYRVITTGKKTNSFSSSILSLVAEKLLGFVSVTTMFILTFPFVTKYFLNNQSLYRDIYLLLILLIVGLVIVWLLIGKRRSTIVSSKLRNLLGKVILMITSKLRMNGAYESFSQDMSKSQNLLSILHDKKKFLLLLVLSLAILFTASVCSQMIFYGIGYEINFAINLFAAPVLFLIFLLPISFGSLGIRETAFVLLYGEFGISLEIALIVSFINLAGLLINNIVGAIVMFVNNIRSNGY